MNKRTKFAVVLGLLLATYIAAYLVLSLGGQYEPGTFGLNGVKVYAWAPCGFYAELTWRHEPEIFFLPLYLIDTHLWHTPDAAYSGRYPITEVAPEDIWKYYEAAGLLEKSSGETKPALLSDEP